MRLFGAHLGDNSGNGDVRWRVSTPLKAHMTDSHPPDFKTDEPEALIRPEDIRSTSRSCSAIILIFIAIILLLCVFVVVQTWVR